MLSACMQNYQEDLGVLLPGESPQKGGDPYTDQDKAVVRYDSRGDVTPFRGVVEREPTDMSLLALLARCMTHANVLERFGLIRGSEDIRNLVRKFS